MAEDHPFWLFSLKIYAEKGVAPACLSLQEDCGVDVNVLLFCCWAGLKGATLTPAQMDQGLVITGPWSRDVVQGLRVVRQRLKGGFDPIPVDQTEPLRQSILSIELAAEKTEQHMLARAVPIGERPDGTGDQSVQAAAVNIACYFKQARLKDSQDRDVHLATLLGACFSESTPAFISETVTNAF